ncbi:hypothetical protein [Heyndrickxia oleronia]|uniref:hypothetical protein n=1 Tax=Heyndrickxia oleronia TaxID=38875 RepID=UPI001B129104|nr:hypothetical protein [Heyndrickxia oleronia]GIN38868.1 hypothetical protein J19TS1_18170 [Heyndrickxia oleronia]
MASKYYDLYLSKERQHLNVKNLSIYESSTAGFIPNKGFARSYEVYSTFLSGMKDLSFQLVKTLHN